jgi:ankyrin repeat protein
MWAGNLVTLIAHGFTKLVKTIGAMVAEKALEEGKWHAFGDDSKPGLWYAMRKTDHMISLLEKNEFPDPLLMTAVRRKGPNLTMMKLLIDEFRVNPNEASLRVHRDYEDPASKPQIHQRESPLHYLAGGDRWWHVHQGLPYLLSLPGIDVDPKVEPTGLTPLHVAISNEYQVVGGEAGVYKYEAGRLLLENGADPNAVVKIGGKTHTCIDLAKHSLEITKMLLSHGAIVTPESFMRVVRSLHIDVLQALLSAGVDPNSVFTPPEIPSARNKGIPQGQDHQVALHITAGSLDQFGSSLDKRPQRRTMIRLLLAHGADPFLRYHVLNRPNRIDKYLRKADARPAGPMSDFYREATAVHEVILRSDCTFLSVLLEHGVNLNVKDAYGLTILHVASLFGLAIFEPWSKVTKEANEVEFSHLVKKQDDDALTSEASDEDDGETVLEHLLAAGADIMTRDHFGRNVLMAMLSGKTGCTEASSRAIRTAINEAPDLINQTDMNGKSVLMYAVKSDRQAKNGALSHASVLIEAGASIHCKKKSGDGLLHILSRFMSTGAQALFRDLVAKGLDINERNASGETSLFVYARRSSRDEQTQRWNKKKGGVEAGATEMFRELGADFTVKDNEGRGLLHVAAMMNIERFKELLAEGLDPLEEDKIGQTAIDKAAASNNIGVLKLFQKDKAGKK